MNALKLIDKLAAGWINWRMYRVASKDPDWKELTELHIKSIEVTDTNGINILGTAPAVAYLADEAAELLTKNDAKNFIQFDMMPRIDRGLKPIRVTVQWASGLSPAEKCAGLERQINDYRAVYKASKRLLANFYEFETITDGEFFDALEKALAEIPVNA